MPDLVVFALVFVQALAGLGAALWRSTRPPQRGVDLTDLTALSRSDFAQAGKGRRVRVRRSR